MKASNGFFERKKTQSLRSVSSPTWPVGHLIAMGWFGWWKSRLVSADSIVLCERK
jgi:hypothetical protein